MNTVDKVLRIAEAEIGYLEKKSNAQLYDKTANAGSANYTKYGKEMHAIYPAVMDFPAAWCDCFVDWCFYNAYGIANAKALLAGNFDDYTVASAQLYKNKSAWHTSVPKAGDQIFFTNGTRICHTGLVYKVDEKNVYTIEGNTSSGSEVIANGGAVCKKKYALDNPRIAGYGRPAYDTSTGHTPIVEGWKQAADGKRWWYQNADGSYPANCWMLINHYWYLFDRDGYMLTGWQQWDGQEIGKGDWYYLDTTKGSTEGQCWHEKAGGKGALEPWYVE